MKKRKSLWCFGLALTMATHGNSIVSLAASQDETSLTDNAYVVIVEESNVLLNEELRGVEEIEETTGKVATLELTPEEAAELRDSPGILAVEENIMLRGLTENELSMEDVYGTVDESEDEELIGNLDQWNLRAINLVKDEEDQGEVIKVEVLDSGISYTDDIDVKEYINLIPGEEALSLLYEDSDGHGTAIGGMIAAKDNGEGITGINPNAEIYSVKALDANLESPLNRIVEGIYWGIENDMDIINMSFGTTICSEVLRQAVRDAAAAGILLIAASGNTPGGSVQYPADFPEVIAVGSTNAQGQIAEHTSMGEEVELLAPGEQVVTTGVFYGVLESKGTSIAAAQVTGIASLLMGKNREKTPEFIRELLKSTSKPIEMDGEYKAGLVDYGYALSLYDEFEGTGEPEVIYNEAPIEDCSEEAEALISGLWSNKADRDGHYNATVWAANSVGGISSRNIELLYKAATNMDSNMKNKFGVRLNALHGRGNYVINLSFLWETAMELAKNDNKVQAINTVYSRVLNRCNLDPNGKDAAYLKELKEGLDPYILQWNMISGGESDKESRKFKILGAAMHMIGDICAHRAMVPVDGASSFNQDYILNSKMAEHTDAELKNWLKNALESDYKQKLKSHANWSLFKRAVATGCMEFRDIDKFVKTQLNGNGETKLVKNYADDATFFNVRFTITKNASTRLLKAQSLAESRRIMIPKTHFIKFNNLKGYFIKAGGSESAIDYWSKVSTNGFV